MTITTSAAAGRFTAPTVMGGRVAGSVRVVDNGDGNAAVQVDLTGNLTGTFETFAIIQNIDSQSIANLIAEVEASLITS